MDLLNSIIEDDVRRIAAESLPWELFAGRTVLVTGAAGFVPAYLVHVLLHLNHTHLASDPCTVVGLVRDVEKAKRRFAYAANDIRLKLHCHDVRLPWANDCKVDWIIHGASPATPKVYRTDPVGTLLPNTIGTYWLLELARQCRSEGFLFLAAGEGYGQLPPDKIPIREIDYGPLDPAQLRSCYAESKRMGETMCVAYWHQYGVRACVARLFHTYGPGFSLNDGRVFADFVGNIVHKEDIVLKSEGTARRAFCYLSDATSALFTILLKGAGGAAYNVGNDLGEIGIRELAERLVGLFPELGLKVRSEVQSGEASVLPCAVQRNCPNIDRLRALGWKPETNIETGFRRTVASFSPTESP